MQGETLWVTVAVTIITSALASSGLWAFATKQTERKCSETKMILGLAHDRIIGLGLHYIDRGFVTADEYENLHKYLFLPYCSLGGNGSAERIMAEVTRLPMSNYTSYYEKDMVNNDDGKTEWKQKDDRVGKSGSDSSN